MRAGLAKTIPEAVIPNNDSVLATCGMLRRVREEVKARIDASEYRVRSDIVGVRDEIKQVETSLRGEIKQVETNLRGEIKQVETSLRGEIKQVETSLRGESQEVRGEIQEVRGDIGGLRGNFAKLAAANELIRADLKDLQAEVHHMAVLVEEQNARNLVVLEGLGLCASRQDQSDKRLDELEKTIRSLAAGRSSGG